MDIEKTKQVTQPYYFSDSGSCVVLKIVSAFSVFSKDIQPDGSTSEFVKGKTLENISLDKNMRFVCLNTSLRYSLRRENRMYDIIRSLFP